MDPCGARIDGLICSREKTSQVCAEPGIVAYVGGGPTRDADELVSEGDSDYPVGIVFFSVGEIMQQLPSRGWIPLLTMLMSSGCIVDKLDASRRHEVTAGAGGVAGHGHANAGAGSVARGGDSASGGTTLGGNAASGGVFMSSAGGAGISGNGPILHTGGTSAFGGADNIGGSTLLGGAANGGAAHPTGGSLATGGSATTGGTATTGGSVTTGGSATTGGTATTGGSSGFGGTNSAGSQGLAGSGSGCLIPSSTGGFAALHAACIRQTAVGRFEVTYDFESASQLQDWVPENEGTRATLAAGRLEVAILPTAPSGTVAAVRHVLPVNVTRLRATSRTLSSVSSVTPHTNIYLATSAINYWAPTAGYGCIFKDMRLLTYNGEEERVSPNGNYNVDSTFSNSLVDTFGHDIELSSTRLAWKISIVGDPSKPATTLVSVKSVFFQGTSRYVYFGGYGSTNVFDDIVLEGEFGSP